MTQEEPQVRWLGAAVPAVAAVLVYAWARWCFGGSEAPSATVALVGGAALVLGAAAVYLLPVRGAGGLFGALFLALGLLSIVVAVEQTAVRGEVAVCVVREVHTKVEPSFGEGATEKTVHRLALDCPGGYPDELKDAPPSVSRGAELRIAYDAGRRVSPAVAGATSPWKPALSALLLLGLSTVLAAGRSRSQA
ncbi:hypothetical protein AB0F18_34580 [Streptomyces sp. NPDC029216]|uniref:hypothetical protein n=1 Tax=Streptomyces sp. NPDC029216 TaxID=3154701 RepID=UPI00340579E4